jgi:hypothetical protein
MAQLCVLREDLYLELKGLQEDQIGSLDDNGDNWRSAYFFRNSIRTLFEIRNALETLKLEKQFLKALALQSIFHQAYLEFDKAMAKSHLLIKRLRHETAGHLDDTAFKKALEKIAQDTKQLFQSGSSPKAVHYKFALEFLGAIFLSEASTDFEDEWGIILKSTADVSFKALKAIDMLFMAYVKQRGFQY